MIRAYSPPYNTVHCPASARAGDGAVSAPVTPCAPEAAVAFVEGRFGARWPKALDPSARLAVARERRITELRRCGELRHAERYGWLSLTGWLLGMKAEHAGAARPDIGGHSSTGPAAATSCPTHSGEDVAPALVTVGRHRAQGERPA